MEETQDNTGKTSWAEIEATQKAKPEPVKKEKQVVAGSDKVTSWENVEKEFISSSVKKKESSESHSPESLSKSDGADYNQPPSYDDQKATLDEYKRVTGKDPSITGVTPGQAKGAMESMPKLLRQAANENPSMLAKIANDKVVPPEPRVKPSGAQVDISYSTTGQLKVKNQSPDEVTLDKAVGIPNKKNQIDRAKGLSAAGNYEASNNALQRVQFDDNDGYISELMAHNYEAMANDIRRVDLTLNKQFPVSENPLIPEGQTPPTPDKSMLAPLYDKPLPGDPMREEYLKQANYLYTTAFHANPNNTRLLPKIASVSSQLGKGRDALQASDLIIKNTGGVAGGDEHTADDLSLAYSIRSAMSKAHGNDEAADTYKQKADYFANAATNIRKDKATQNIAGTMKTMPDYLMTSPYMANVLFGPMETIMSGLDKIGDAFAGKKDKFTQSTPGTMVKSQQDLTGWERMVHGLTGLWEVGIGAGSLTPAGWGSGGELAGAGLPTLMKEAKLSKVFTKPVSFIFPEMAEFNMVLTAGKMVTPEQIYNWIAAPMSTILQKAGYDEKDLSVMQQAGVSIANMFVLVKMSHAAGNLTGKIKTVENVPEYVRYAEKAYQKFKDNEQLTQQEMRTVYATIENATEQDRENMSTLTSVYMKQKSAVDQAKELVSKATAPAYRVNNNVYDTPEDAMGGIRQLLSKGTDPSNIDIEVRNDVENASRLQNFFSDQAIESAQERLNMPTNPEEFVTPETSRTLERLNTSEPILNEDLSQASRNLYEEYKRMRFMKESDTRKFTTRQINQRMKLLGDQIDMLENRFI